MSDNFYRAFEEKHRGTSELIISRLRTYLFFVLPLKEIYPVAPAIDLGCGRGEWLELLLQEGFLPRGVDQDEGMLQGCMDRNLPAEKGDIIEYLSTLSDESQTIVSAFHVVEHISFDQLRTLVSEALRVLKPGGLLIMETPNPENIIVATRNFYLDPTHQRPIPPQLLSFLPEYYGFARTKILRLQESKELVGNVSPKLNDVFEGVSPDYAVVAQKAASSETLELFDETFDQEYGLQLTTLAERYDAAILAKAKQAEIIAQQAEAKAQQAEVIAQQAEAKAQQAEVIAQQAEAKAQQAETAITSIYNSRSWGITHPLRWFALQVRLFRMHGAKNRIKAAARKVAVPMLRKALGFVNTRPNLRQQLVALAKRIGAYDSIKRFYYSLQRIDGDYSALVGRGEAQSVPLPQLTHRARKIYTDIQVAIEKRK
ncbi:class I SAM-dependent methyltransferase [Acinetobacter sp. ANC 4277]|uniref:class I SAM-dependent methyltransferase n=1 Tax=Acinetobacter terrae TaxID=2731247 RepID=UPI00148FC934|nr:class I SAM-dependent methyltransferase [Acinetobacter terrae]NNG77212.1 class I SAM-dependent methyltransferase [Acinetobacter terrae]